MGRHRESEPTIDTTQPHKQILPSGSLAMTVVLRSTMPLLLSTVLSRAGGMGCLFVLVLVGVCWGNVFKVFCCCVESITVDSWVGIVGWWYSDVFFFEGCWCS